MFNKATPVSEGAEDGSVGFWSWTCGGGAAFIHAEDADLGS
jgi:hypothetical protein